MKINSIISDILEENGYESYIVGGCVRDYLLTRDICDIDIATIARPDEIISVFKDYKIIDIGKKFGTIKVIYEGREYEITTFREESGYNDMRHPDKIKFSKNFYEDLKRRDFTINAMAYRHGEILDPFLGRADLDKKIIRAVGNPYDRIKEDMLRALRAVRFATTLNFDIEENLMKAIRDNSRFIEDISKERIQVEIDKILLSKNVRRGIDLLKDSNLLKYIFPEVEKMVGFDQHSSFHPEDLYNHSLSVLEKTPANLKVRMAALYHDVGKVDTFFLDERNEGRFFGHQNLSEELLRNRLKILKYSNKFIEDTTILVKRHMDNSNTYTKKSIRKLLRNIGEDNLLNLFELQIADIKSTSHQDISNIDLGKRLLKEVKVDDIPKTRSEIKINGNDLKKLGYKEGKELGKILNEVEDLIYEEALKNDKKEIINYIKLKNKNVDRKL